MASSAQRQLLQGASGVAPLRAWTRPAASRLLPRANPYSCRLLSNRSHPRERTPPAPAPPSQPSEYAQKAQERALLARLSALSPAQITNLLSSQDAGAPNAPPLPPSPPGVPTYFANSGSPGPGAEKTGRWRRWGIRALFAGVAVFLGYQVGELAADHVGFQYLDRFDELIAPEEDQYVENAQMRSMMFFAALASAGPQGFVGVPLAGTCDILSSGIVSYRYFGFMTSGFAQIAGRITPVESGLTLGDNPDFLYKVPGHRLAWPAHMHLLNRAETTGHLASLRRQHLVAGTYGSVHTLGTVYQVVQDAHTNDLSIFVTFGSKMNGMVGMVHPGAIATVMDESMGRLAARVLPANTAVTAKLILDHQIAELSPNCTVRIKLDVMSKEAAAQLQYVLEDEKATTLRPAGKIRPAMAAFPDRDPNEMLPVLKKGAKRPVRPQLDDVQNERKVWIKATMYTANDKVRVCDAFGLFVVPKDVELAPLGDEW